jgi:ABC-type phosphate transport system substrate-binding protein
MKTTRRNLVLTSLLAVLGFTWPKGSEAGGEVIAVIVNKSNPAGSLGQNELRPIFQTTKKVWGSGEDAIPINLPEDSPLRNDFDQAVLGLDPERVARYWTDRKVRGGARPPVRVPSSAAVLRAVAAKAGAVGYVKLSEVNGSVKVVAKISGGRLSGP